MILLFKNIVAAILLVEQERCESIYIAYLYSIIVLFIARSARGRPEALDRDWKAERAASGGWEPPDPHFTGGGGHKIVREKEHDA
ncbi:MAG: hypothetical protein OCU22_08100 [Canidatus Methanoxibalbensis ujae]|nr:hypothetical protein [Candidatus Methanoxibalbensis ujae]